MLSSLPETASQRASQARRRHMEDELIAVAKALFTERGFDGVTVEDIAGRAGVSPRTFYRYFTAKEDIVIVAAGRLLDQYAETMATRPPGQSTLAAIIAMVEALDATIHQDHFAWMAITAGHPSLMLYLRGALQDRARSLLAQSLAEELQVDDPNDLRVAVMAAAIIAAIDVATERWVVAGEDRNTLMKQGLEILDERFLPSHEAG